MMEMKRVNAYAIKLFALPRLYVSPSLSLSLSVPYSYLKRFKLMTNNQLMFFFVVWLFCHVLLKAISFWWQRLTNQDDIDVCWFSILIEIFVQVAKFCANKVCHWLDERVVWEPSKNHGQKITTKWYSCHREHGLVMSIHVVSRKRNVVRLNQNNSHSID